VPRRYSLGKRADERAATRARIVGAALAIFRDQGSRAATTPVIARAADVSAGTVRNHFPDRADLDRAVADLVLEEIRLPGAEIFAGLDTIIERVERLAHELADFSVRSEMWWYVRQADPDLAVAWAGHEQRYEEHLGRLVDIAVRRDDTDATDRAVAAVVRTVVGSPMYYALRGAGLSSDEAVDVEMAVLLPWLRTQEPRRALSPPTTARSRSARQGRPST
jgi:AcrR family transcriptional regulator